MLELMEAVHFLHNTAKLVHFNITPENIYITKEGKVKLAGFSWWKELKETKVNADFAYTSYMDSGLALAPNVRFAAPEIVAKNMGSWQSDIFSLGWVLYFLLNIDKGEDAYILKTSNTFSTAQHIRLWDELRINIESKFADMPYNMKTLFISILDYEAANRGSVNSMVENVFFQDPLIKTIRYLETIEHKEQHNVVQFLTGLSRILEKFDKRCWVKKVIPLMLKVVDKGELSVLIMPPIIKLLKADDFIDKSTFLETMWPSIAKLWKAEEMPAQTLFILVENTELFFNYVSASDFQASFLPLILKSLDWGVHKLQNLGISRIPLLSKKIEYMTFKNQVMPRLVLILTSKDTPLILKEKGWEVLIEILSVFDRNFLRDNILKTLQILRDSSNEPTLCMHILSLYNGIASALTPEDIGNKILPGLIPMLISASFTKSQFNKLISTIRSLIDELEKHRLKDLSEMDPLGESNTGKQKGDRYSSLYNDADDPNNALPPPENEGDFDFLSVVEGTQNKSVPKPSAIDSVHSKSSDIDKLSSFGGNSDSFSSKPEPKLKSDIFKGINSNPPNSKPSQVSSGMSLNKPSSSTGFDPFNTSGPLKGLPKPGKMDLGKPNDLFAEMDPFSTGSQPITNTNPFDTSKPVQKLSDPFSNFGSSLPLSKPQQNQPSLKSQTINMTSGFKSMGDGSDPFAEILKEEKKEESKSNPFSGFSSGLNSKSGFSDFNQPKKVAPQPVTQTYPKQSSFGTGTSDPFSSMLSSDSSTKTNKSFTSGPSYGGNSSGGSSSLGAQSSFTFGGQSSTKQQSFSSDTFSSSAPRSGSFKSPPSAGVGFPTQSVPTAPTAPPMTGFAFPSNIDMNAPMDQNTMNMMIGMMNSFTQQFQAQNTQPAFNPFSFQSNQSSSGSKPPSSGSGGKGIFD